MNGCGKRIPGGDCHHGGVRTCLCSTALAALNLCRRRAWKRASGQLYLSWINLNRLSSAEIESRSSRPCVRCSRTVLTFRTTGKVGRHRTGRCSIAGDLRRLPVLERSVYQQQGEACRAERLPGGSMLSRWATRRAPAAFRLRSQDDDAARTLVERPCYLRTLEWCGLRSASPTGDLASDIRFGNSSRLLSGVALPTWHPQAVHVSSRMGPACVMDLHREHAASPGSIASHPNIC